MFSWFYISTTKQISLVTKVYIYIYGQTKVKALSHPCLITAFSCETIIKRANVHPALVGLAFSACIIPVSVQVHSDTRSVIKVSFCGRVGLVQ